MARKTEPNIATVDELGQSFDNSQKYPFTLPISLPRALPQHYYELLSQHSSTLCHESRSYISLWRLRDGEQTFRPETKVDTPTKLSEHLNHDDKDARCLHIFMNSANSRLPLNCSKDLLESLLTSLRIDPFFLDHLFTFGKQVGMEPLDPTWCHFKNHRATSLQSFGAALSSPGRPGRSGEDIRHSFLLRTVERAPSGTPGVWPWSVRQVAVYHSSDLGTGKAVWVTAKGNDVIKNEIITNATSFPAFTSAGISPDHVISSFEAALETHLIYFRWCEKDWRWFIRDIEQHIRETTTKTRGFPVGRRPHSENLPLRTGTGLSSPITGDYPPQSPQMEPRQSFFRSVFRHRQAGQPPIPHVEAPPERTEDGSEDMEAHVLGMFTHKDLQTLTTIQRRVEDGRAILENNRHVLKRASKSFQTLPYPANMDEITKRAIDGKLSNFILATDEIMEDLETSERGLLNLRTKLEQADRPMLESILQLRPSHASRIFEEHAHQSSIAMQEIADQTKDLTNSTHIISVIAFCLLWAQFATGFLQSGIIQWQDEQDGSGWGFRTTAFLAFLGITAPMTLIALGFWYWKRRSSREQSRLRI